MASKRNSTHKGNHNAPSDTSQDTHSSPYIPAPPDEGRRRHGRRTSNHRRDNHRDPYGPMRRTGGSRHHRRERGYSLPHEKGAKLTIVLSLYHPTTQHWVTAPVTIDRSRDNDVDLWSDVRRTFRDQLQKPWRRLFGFKRVQHIMPITYTVNGIPLRSKKSPQDFIEGHAFMHAYHHPERLHPEHHWVEWFERFERENTRDDMWGLEFIEGLWADKLAAVAILLTAAIIVVSAVWCARGGELQTVFTVMSFVLGGVTAELALVALYYQVTSPG